MKPLLIIVRGIPGSGKTTWVNNQRKHETPGTNHHFEADMYFEQLNPITGIIDYNFDVTKLGQAHAWCKQQTRQALEQGRKVYVSNTFSTIKELAPYIEMAQELQAKVVIHEMSEIPVVEGKRKSIHNVPQHVIDRMIKRWDLKLPSDWNTIQYFIH